MFEQRERFTKHRLTVMGAHGVDRKPMLKKPRSAGQSLFLGRCLVQNGSEDEQLAVWHGGIAAHPSVKKWRRDSKARGKVFASQSLRRLL